MQKKRNNTTTTADLILLIARNGKCLGNKNKKKKKKTETIKIKTINGVTVKFNILYDIIKCLSLCLLNFFVIYIKTSSTRSALPLHPLK